MQTQLSTEFSQTPEGREAEAVLRKCVHCGFCNATCPTYQLLGDELDGPRGRIYQIKQVLEGAPVTQATQLHLDRCLTCRNCETTCPSGVEYGRLLDIGRNIVEARAERSATDKSTRWLLKNALPQTGLFSLAMKVGRLFKPALPAALANKVPQAAPRGHWPAPRHARRMIALAGCVQPAMMPDINAATARVLDKLGISLTEVSGAGCCGALRFHLNAQEEGRDDMRRNIDAWWPLIERGEVEAIVMTASGCGVTVREYGHLLQHDARYAAKARRISELTRDISEIVDAEQSKLAELIAAGAKQAPAQTAQQTPTNLAFHPPCTLQHGQKVRGVTERVLRTAGFTLTPVPDSHLCCGSAGTYSVLQPEIANQLRDNKVAALESGKPQGIASSNIGCLSHIAGATQIPVRHWIEWLDLRLA